ncbi:MAG: peptidoglycan DD-metalloendopeptidase family protein [Firmicutes bacterium]|nr:peptidoglycan DD-metalloendopeptidase family protein [Bacillota bacterium]
MSNQKPFPYCLVGVKIHRVLGDVQKGAPLYVSLAECSPYKKYFESSTQQEFNDALFNKIHKENNASWSVGGYLEDRRTILRDYEQMITMNRCYHLGLDINAPVGTAVYAPLDAEVIVSEYEAGDGNYGGLVLLKCTENGTTFYLLFGHLERASLPKVGAKLKAGQQFAKLGDFHENGNWYHHLHLQVITEKGYNEGWLDRGYCTLEDIPTLSDYAPNPTIFLFC